MSFWVLAAIELGTLILGQLLKPKVKRPTAQALEGWFAEEGRAIPIVYGTQALSPNIVWWGDGHQDDDDLGTYYRANMLGTLCLGPVDALVDLQFGQKSIRLEPLTKAQSSSGTDDVTDPAFPADGFARSGDSAQTVTLHARQMFGGRFREGGVEGEVRFHFGTVGQAVDSLTTHSVADQTVTEGTARPGVCYLALGAVPTSDSDVASRFYWGRTPTPKELTVIVRRQPRALLDLDLDDAYTDHTVGHDANPAEILYDLLTSQTCGAGVDAALLDTASFAAAAATLQREQFGLSITLASQDEVKDLLDDVCRYIDGVLQQDLETGLLTLALVRSGYTVADLPSLTVSNASDFQRSEPNWRALVNEVRVTYRKWSGGTFGDVTDEVLTHDLQFVGFTTAFYRAKGRNLSNVTVKADGVELTVLDDYTFSPDSGVFAIFDTANTAPGQTITASYSAAPTAMRLVEGVAPDYDLADQTITQEVRSATLDFPYITNELLAQTVAARQIRALGLPLQKGSCRVDRSGHGIAVGDPVRITYAPWDWDDFVVRVTNIPDGGRLEDGKITLEWVEDVWGVDTLPNLPGSGGDQQNQKLTCPPMAALYCSGTADQLVLQASDPAFSIELQRADDIDGTNAADVAESPLPGTTTSYTDTTASKTHRARQVRDGWNPGPWTDWLTFCVTGTPPGCVLPTITDSPVVDGTTGTLVVDILDDQLRVRSVEFQVTTAAGIVGAWTTATSPYSATVPLVDGATAYISRRVTYYDCDAVLQTAVATFPFTVAVEVPEPPTGLSQVPVPIPLLGFTLPWLAWGVPAARTPFSEDGVEQEYVDLTGAASCYLTGVATETSLDAGAMIGGEFENPDVPDDWRPLEDPATGEGPFLTIDQTSVGTDLGRVRKGDSIAIRPEAQQLVRVRGVILGGDESPSKRVGIARVMLWPSVQAVTLPPPEVDDPPEFDPGSCDTPGDLDLFAYADLTALGAVWPED